MHTHTHMHTYTHTSRDDHAKVQSVLRGFSKGLGLLRQGVARGWELVTAAGSPEGDKADAQQVFDPFIVDLEGKPYLRSDLYGLAGE